MPFGIIGRTGPGMSEVVGFKVRSTGRGTFGGEFGAHHCNKWGLYGVRVRQGRDTALFPNYLWQTCDIIIIVHFPLLFTVFSPYIRFHLCVFIHLCVQFCSVLRIILFV